MLKLNIVTSSLWFLLRFNSNMENVCFPWVFFCATYFFPCPLDSCTVKNRFYLSSHLLFLFIIFLSIRYHSLLGLLKSLIRKVRRCQHLKLLRKHCSIRTPGTFSDRANGFASKVTSICDLILFHVHSIWLCSSIFTFQHYFSNVIASVCIETLLLKYRGYI